ncbi:hypothetical protein M0813_20661 [Anaeramoeba flamelloides]|uniref:non-specific serine/threonine protein kinase n=1 Tax=Anaeramoeba flamelloides TaxID=1746091 RepID=A0ABQ8YJX1_9EUKA|nr:hypothetical protein M0813_20661 [Anaeramoeba flamelloides]
MQKKKKNKEEQIWVELKTRSEKETKKKHEKETKKKHRKNKKTTKEPQSKKDTTKVFIKKTKRSNSNPVNLKKQKQKRQLTKSKFTKDHKEQEKEFELNTKPKTKARPKSKSKDHTKKNKLKSAKSYSKRDKRSKNRTSQNFDLVVPNLKKFQKKNKKHHQTKNQQNNKKKYKSKTPRGNRSNGVNKATIPSDWRKKMTDNTFGGFDENTPNFNEISDTQRNYGSKSNSLNDHKKKKEKSRKKKKKEKLKRKEKSIKEQKLKSKQNEIQTKANKKHKKKATRQKKKTEKEKINVGKYIKSNNFVKNNSKESKSKKSTKTRSFTGVDSSLFDGQILKEFAVAPRGNNGKAKSIEGYSSSSDSSEEFENNEKDDKLDLGFVSSSSSNEDDEEDKYQNGNLNFVNKENPDEYCKGGYNPTKVGDIFKERYKALIKIGWGYFSTVWLVEDLKYGGKMVRTKAGKIVMKEKYLALKIVKSSKIFAQVAIDEIKILFKCAMNDPEDKFNIVRLTDHFTHKGPNGRHICMVFEFLDQNHLLSFLKKHSNDGLPINIVKQITKQTLIGLHHLHSRCKVIHTDIKPENIMIYTKPGNIPPRLKKKLASVQKKLKKENGIQKEKSGKEKKKINLQKKKAQNKKRIKLKKNKIKNKNDNEINDIEINGVDQNSFTNYSKNFFSTGIPQRQSKTRMITNIKQQERQKHNQKQQLKQRRQQKQKQKQRQKSQIQQNDNAMNKKSNTKKEVLHGIEFTVSEAKELWGTVNTPLNQKKKKRRTNKTINISPKDIKCKIVDLGNACWFDRHFSNLIQTREYRSPEVILGHDYNETADIWSMACMVFELLTGEVLFQPISNNPQFQDEEHLALMISLLGKFSPVILLTGRNSELMVDQNGNLLHYNNIPSDPLKKRLIDTYNFDTKDAEQIASFLFPMLNYDPKKRISAKKCLKHEWLKTIDVD